MTNQLFTKKVTTYYAAKKRELPWRTITQLSVKDRGYIVVVSEIMLQQTQVNRVKHKFTEWMEKWPTIDDFVHASLAEVLVAWNGLGYNRRAKYLYQALHSIHTDYNGIVPQSIEALTALPGIGRNTAAAIVVYTYNQPIPFIETNIRTVFLHEFFADTDDKVADADILRKVQQTQDDANPREWYYALMDYGTFLKQSAPSMLQRSKAYKKQSKFNGSKRQLRGMILRLLTQQQAMHRSVVMQRIPDERTSTVITELQSEGLISIDREGQLRLPGREMVY